MNARIAWPALSVLGACFLCLAGCPSPPTKPDPSNGTPDGSFDGFVHTKWLLDGRNMVLLEDVVFHDSRGVTWTAPKGAVINGSSIPQVFWTVLTGPYEGKHRDASVNHDYECCVKQQRWQDVHRMFFDAMLARGEERWRADVMYFAVYNFGPRWPQRAPVTGFTEGDIARAVEYFQTNPDVSVEQIERLQPAQLRLLVPVPSLGLMSRSGLTPERALMPVDRLAPCLESQLAK